LKSFTYYNENKIPYPNKVKKREELKSVIDNTPMTREERAQADAQLDQQVREWFRESVKPYDAEEARLRSEFWQDCKDEIGYGYLTPRGQLILESQAWEDGHAHGYESVFSRLIALEEFLNRIRKEIIP